MMVVICVLSVFGDDMSDSELGPNGDMGRKQGDFIMFDKVHGKFTFYDGGFMREGDGGRDVDPIPTYAGYELIWGSATNLSPNNRCLAILNNGTQTRLVMLENGPGIGIGGKVRTKALVKEVSGELSRVPRSSMSPIMLIICILRSGMRCIAIRLVICWEMLFRGIVISCST